VFTGGCPTNQEKDWLTDAFLHVCRLPTAHPHQQPVETNDGRCIAIPVFLHDAGVDVMFRPLYEMNHHCFW
jgi:hypothetical protein